MSGRSVTVESYLYFYVTNILLSMNILAFVMLKACLLPDPFVRYGNRGCPHLAFLPSGIPLRNRFEAFLTTLRDLRNCHGV